MVVTQEMYAASLHIDSLRSRPSALWVQTYARCWSPTTTPVLLVLTMRRCSLLRQLTARGDMDGDDQNRFGRRRTRKIAPGGSVTRTIPPQALIDAINPLVRRLATSPLHRAVDSSVLLLHVTGRRTKRLYSIPVGYVAFDERLLIVTQHAWRANLRGGADVEITLGGRRRAMRANLDEAPESVAATCGVVIERCGWPEARRRLGISTRSGKAPSAGELVEGAREHNLAIVSLLPPDRRSP